MGNVVVVDTSIVIKWVIREADSAIAERLLRDWHTNRMSMLAPSLLAYEVTNVLHQHVRKGVINYERATTALKIISRLDLELRCPQSFDFHTRAMELAQQYNLPAAYDTHYLALAERETCELWTADTRMWKAIQGQLSWVHNLSDYH